MQSNSEPYLTLLVEDKTFRTTQGTLTKYPESKLAKTFSDAGIMTMKTSEGHIFVDRDPKYFAQVLMFLRSGQIKYEDQLSDNKFILAEFDYWGLPLPSDSEFSMKKLPNSINDDNNNRHTYRSTKPIHFYCDVVFDLYGKQGTLVLGDTSQGVYRIEHKQCPRVIFNARKKSLEIDGKVHPCPLTLTYFDIKINTNCPDFVGVKPVLDNEKEYVK